jgi:hypothetical protein
MNIRTSLRHEDFALIDAWARSVFDDRRGLIGRVHRTDAGWLAESIDGCTLGSYPTERLAVRAVLDAAWVPA